MSAFFFGHRFAGRVRRGHRAMRAADGGPQPTRDPVRAVAVYGLQGKRRKRNGLQRVLRRFPIMALQGRFNLPVSLSASACGHWLRAVRRRRRGRRTADRRGGACENARCGRGAFSFCRGADDAFKQLCGAYAVGRDGARCPGSGGQWISMALHAAKSAPVLCRARLDYAECACVMRSALGLRGARMGYAERAWGLERTPGLCGERLGYAECACTTRSARRCRAAGIRPSVQNTMRISRCFSSYIQIKYNIKKHLDIMNIL